MALLGMFGMDLYSVRADLQSAGWQIGDNTRVEVLTSGGRFNGGCVEVEYYDLGLSRSIAMTGSTFITQFSFKHARLSDATYKSFVEFHNNGGGNFCGRFTITPSGEIRAYDKDAAYADGSAAGVIKENVWQHAEMKIVIGDTGSLVARIDGVEVINATGIDTKPSTHTDVDKVLFNGASGDVSTGIFYDDFIFKDGSGSLNNDFSGDRRIYTLLPTGDDGTEADFSSQPSQGAGNTYLNVDDAIPGAPDDDSSYNYSSTPGDETLHDFGDLPVTPATIDAVQVTLETKKSDGGARSMAAVLKADVKTAGATFNPGTGYEARGTIWEQTTEAVPAAWTGLKVNSAQAGYKLVS
jgi:hypothetical protein